MLRKFAPFPRSSTAAVVSPLFRHQQRFAGINTATAINAAMTGLNASGGKTVTAVTVGLMLLSTGIVLINLNERRYAKQARLDDIVEPFVVSLTDEQSARHGGKLRRRRRSGASAAQYGDDDDSKNDTFYFESDKECDGMIVHAAGKLEAKGPNYPCDDSLGAEAPGMLRLRRVVEMYQWKVDGKTTRKDAHGNEHTEYKYGKEWARHQNELEGPKTNPRFPFMNDVREADEVNIIIPARPDPDKVRRERLIKEEQQSGEQQNKKPRGSSSSSSKESTPATTTGGDVPVLLSYDYVERLNTFESADGRVVSPDNWKTAKRKYDLCPTRGEGKWGRASIGFDYDLVSCAALADPDSPAEIGDVRVRYLVVPSGPGTAIGQYNYNPPNEADQGLVAISGNLKKSLTSAFGALVVPEEANAVVRTTARLSAEELGGASGDFMRDFRLTPPEWLVQIAEWALLKAVPIEYAYVTVGKMEDKEAAFAAARREQQATAGWLGKLGSTACGLGGMCVAAAVPMSVVGGPVALSAGFSAGVAAAVATRRGARAQVSEKLIEEEDLPRPKRNRDGGFDV